MIDWKYPAKGENPPLVKGCKIIAALCFYNKTISRAEILECFENEGVLSYSYINTAIIAWALYNEPEVHPVPNVCPYCGCKKIDLQGYIISGRLFYVCTNKECSYRGPCGDTKKEATINHNKVTVKE